MTKHKDIEIEMAEIKTDIKYIRKSIDSNAIEHKEIIVHNEKQHKEIMEVFATFVLDSNNKLESKADKKELKDLKNYLIKSLVWFIGILITIIAFFLKNEIMENLFI